MVGAERAMPEPFRSAHHWWNKRKIQRWCSRTTDEVIAELISNPKLAAVLSAQWGTYGGKPKEASLSRTPLMIQVRRASTPVKCWFGPIGRRWPNLRLEVLRSAPTSRQHSNRVSSPR
jgi:hypothetical protein